MVVDRTADQSADMYRTLAVMGRVQGSVARLHRLTNRQREVLRLLAAGATNKQIATHLSIAGPTVESHVKDLKHKLNIDSRSLLAVVGYFDLVSRISGHEAQLED